MFFLIFVHWIKDCSWEVVQITNSNFTRQIIWSWWISLRTDFGLSSYIKLKIKTASEFAQIKEVQVAEPAGQLRLRWCPSSLMPRRRTCLRRTGGRFRCEGLCREQAWLCPDQGRGPDASIGCLVEGRHSPEGRLRWFIIVKDLHLQS